MLRAMAEAIIDCNPSCIAFVMMSDKGVETLWTGEANAIRLSLVELLRRMDKVQESREQEEQHGDDIATVEEKRQDINYGD